MENCQRKITHQSTSLRVIYEKVTGVQINTASFDECHRMS
jgi:hypothetical protein